MKKTIFTGSGVAIVTPMNDDFSINYAKLGELIDWQVEQGQDAIIICGTTGESTVMTDQEHVECIRCAVERVAGRVPVIAGAGSNDTAYAVWLSKESKALGADALLHVTPYYNKTSQMGLLRHFDIVANATDLPVIVYNVPGRTGLDVKPETYLEMSKHPNLVAIKEASGNIGAAAKTAALVGENMHLYSGNDDQIVPIMSLGGKGVISVMGNVAPKLTHLIPTLYLEGKTSESTALQLKLMDLCSALFCDVNPIPVKEALNLMGRGVGPCRMPLVELSDANRTMLSAVLQKHGLL